MPFDTNCSDGSCSSGLLISRLQIPNRCYEPPQSVFDPLNPIGQFVYLTDDNLTYTQFPRTTILLTWTPANNNQFTYRWSRGQENALIVEYTLAVNDIVVSSQWTDVPNNGNTPTLVVNGTFVKEPVAGCYSGYCEAQPITSTLHVDTQGFCDQIDTISVYQQQWNAPFGQVAPAFVNFRPNCSQLYNTNELLFCVWNNRNTRVSINYRTRGSTNIATVPSPSNDINCQVTPAEVRRSRRTHAPVPQLGLLGRRARQRPHPAQRGHCSAPGRRLQLSGRLLCHLARCSAQHVGQRRLLLGSRSVRTAAHHFRGLLPVPP